MLTDVSTSAWLTGKPFRIFVLLLGIGLFVVYGMMLIVVGINLPDSWGGLVYTIVGLAGGIACFSYFRSQKRILLVPIFAALILMIGILVGTLLFGHKVDEGLQKNRGQQEQAEREPA